MTSRMTTRTRTTIRKRKTTSNPASPKLHPIFRDIHLKTMRLSFAAVCLAAALVSALVMLSAPVALAQSQSAAPPDKVDKKTLELRQTCLIAGNVFTADGHLLYGADVHIYKSGDKHSKYETVVNRQGEFFVRVAPGADYVVEIKSKGFVTQRQKVTANASSRVDVLFHMDPGTDKKQ